MQDDHGIRIGAVEDQIATVDGAADAGGFVARQERIGAGLVEEGEAPPLHLFNKRERPGRVVLGDVFTDEQEVGFGLLGQDELYVPRSSAILL